MNNKRIKWIVLLVFPTALFLLLLPVTHRRQKRRASQALMQEIRGKGEARFNRIKELIAQGADVNERYNGIEENDKKDFTPLYFCVMNNDLRAMQLLLENGADIDARAINDTTPLIIAADMGYSDAVQLLIREGARLNLRTAPRQRSPKGKTALGIAITRSKTGWAQATGLRPQFIRTIRLLKAAGAKE